MVPEIRVYFEQELDIGFAITGVCYLLLGALGYGLFGSCSADTVTLSLMATTPILGRVASIMVLINGFFSIPVWMRPVERITLEWFGREARHVAESAKGQRLLVMVRMGLLVGAVIITSRVPSFGAAISLMGGFSAALTSIVLPVTFYYMVHQETLQSWQKWLCWLAIFLGLTALLVGLSSLFGSTWMLMWLAAFSTFTGIVVTLQRAIAVLHVAFMQEKEEQARSSMPEEQLRGGSRQYRPDQQQMFHIDSFDKGKAEDAALQAAIARIQGTSRQR